MLLDDTIVAVSSPPGIGIRGIIRLSGREAFALAADVFDRADGESLTAAGGHRRWPGRVRFSPGAAVPAEAYTFRAPASYTRQDVVELHTVGSPPVLASLLDRLTDLGARMAEPGEFTRRAYLAGAMDLTRVEGVAAMIHARTDSQLRASAALLHGRLSRRSTELREELADLLALIEAQIDFAEEPIEFVSAARTVQTLDRVAGALDDLLRHAPSVERLEVLPKAVLVGRPNAGKSTLFNRLTGLERAIQSATMGTTRDVISAPLNVPGGEIVLCDTAGLGPVLVRGSDERLSPSDVLAGRIEQATQRSTGEADLLLLVVDAADNPRDAIEAVQGRLGGRLLRVVVSKIDRLSPDERAMLNARLGPQVIAAAVSALTGEGVEELRAEIGRTLFYDTETHGSDVLALSNRQRAMLGEALEAVRRARAIGGESPDVARYAELLALEIRAAVNALSLLTGEVTTEDLLGRIFARFCIGK